MNPLAIAVLAAVVGVLIGSLSMVAFYRSERQRRRVSEAEDEPHLPPGASEVLSVVGLAYVVIDALDGVVRASPAAYAFGLVRGHTVVHQELLDIAAEARRDGVVEEEQVELPRGSWGESSMIIQLRVATLGEDYVLILAEDRTDFVRTEAIRNDFVANVSHELKTPVGAISLLAEALDTSPEDENTVRRFAQSIHKESVRLSSLIQDIIEFSRLQGADVVERGELVDLNQALAEAIDRSRLSADSRRIELVLGGRAEQEIYGEHDLLVTAFHNLIDNAIHYSEEGTTVGIGIREDGETINVFVSDQGEGIDAENLDRIFERFYRVDTARSRQTGGSGLGLSIVKHIISNHSGEVSVWSQPGKGSTFTVRLPNMSGREDVAV